jgi:hypothetical protein
MDLGIDDHVAQAAAAAGARLIHVSALGADADSPALYARTKAAGEQAVLAGAGRRRSSAPRSCSGRRTTSSTASPPWRA